MGYFSSIFESSRPEVPSRVHLSKPVESPCSIHQAGILVSFHCLTLLDKQALYLLVTQGKLPFTLCYPVKYFLTTTLQAAESLLVPTALELVNNSLTTNKHLQLRVPHRRAAPQAANQRATLLEWGVYLPLLSIQYFTSWDYSLSHDVMTVSLLILVIGPCKFHQL